MEHKLVNNWRIIFRDIHVREIMYKSSSHFIHCIIWLKNGLKCFAIWGGGVHSQRNDNESLNLFLVIYLHGACEQERQESNAYPAVEYWWRHLVSLPISLLILVDSCDHDRHRFRRRQSAALENCIRKILTLVNFRIGIQSSQFELFRANSKSVSERIRINSKKFLILFDANRLKIYATSLVSWATARTTDKTTGRFLCEINHSNDR